MFNEALIFRDCQSLEVVLNKTFLLNILLKSLCTWVGGRGEVLKTRQGRKEIIYFFFNIKQHKVNDVLN